MSNLLQWTTTKKNTLGVQKEIQSFPSMLFANYNSVKLSKRKKLLTCMQWIAKPGPVYNFLWHIWHLKCFAFWCCIRIFSSSKSLLQYLVTIVKVQKYSTITLLIENKYAIKDNTIHYLTLKTETAKTKRTLYKLCFWYYITRNKPATNFGIFNVPEAHNLFTNPKKTHLRRQYSFVKFQRLPDLCEINFCSISQHLQTHDVNCKGSMFIKKRKKTIYIDRTSIKQNIKIIRLRIYI